ncbi:MAG: hypothetical protein ACPL88_03215, partial [Bryobacteraceae bacterium]
MPRANGEAENGTAILDGAGLKPTRAEVVRYLGYPAGAEGQARVAERLDQILGSLPDGLRPRSVYRIYPVTRASPHRLELAGGAVFQGRIGEFLGQAERAAVFVATAGPEIVKMAEAAMRARDTRAGLVYHAVGAALAEAMVERTIEQL